MSDSTAWIFPGTVPQPSVLLPLVHVFPSLVYLQAIEDDPDLEMNGNSVTAALLEAGRLKLRAPAPLGDDRERFLALISDLRYRKDDYREMLSNLSLAAIGRGPSTESRQSIISQLTGAAQSADKEKEELMLLLWQARLVLKLGEILDIEQEELATELESINKLEDSLFAELKEETDEPFALTRDIGDTVHNNDPMVDHRVKAWSQIFHYGNNLPEEPPRVLVTPESDLVERMKDQYESMTKSTCPPSVQIELQLPAAKELQELHTFPSPSPSLAKLCQILLDPHADTQEHQRCIDGWNREKDQQPGISGEAIAEQATLTLQPFPEVSAGELLLSTFCRVQTPGKNGAGVNGCLVGFIE